MTKAEQAQTIMNMVIGSERQASRALANQHISLSGQVAMEKEWDRQHEGDFETNPYSSGVAAGRQVLGRLMLELDAAREVTQLAVDTFTGMIA